MGRVLKRTQAALLTKKKRGKVCSAKLTNPGRTYQRDQKLPN